MRDWIKKDLAPALEALRIERPRQFKNLKLLTHDDVRMFTSEIDTILDNAENQKAVSGIGIQNASIFKKKFNFIFRLIKCCNFCVYTGTKITSTYRQIIKQSKVSQNIQCHLIL